MRELRFAVAFAASVGFVSPALAETHIFLIDGNDGYGIDRCLIAGEQCGKAAARAICRSRQYAQALDFGRLDQKEITGAVPDSARIARCQGNGCPQTVAVTCTR